MLLNIKFQKLYVNKNWKESLSFGDKKYTTADFLETACSLAKDTEKNIIKWNLLSNNISRNWQYAAPKEWKRNKFQNLKIT